MSALERIITVTLGVAAIVWAFLPGVTFYPGGFGIVDRTRPIPKWFGRILFTACGLFFIISGLKGGISLLVEKIIAVGLGALIIINSLSARESERTIPPDMFGAGVYASHRRWFGRLLGLAIGLFFVFVGLGLKR
jgi:hypothetical protein